MNTLEQQLVQDTPLHISDTPTREISHTRESRYLRKAALRKYKERFENHDIFATWKCYIQVRFNHPTSAPSVTEEIITDCLRIAYEMIVWPLD